MDWDETAITILDDTGKHEDVQFIVYDDITYIRQWSEEWNKFHLIAMTTQMFDELATAMNLPEGAYAYKKD